MNRSQIILIVVPFLLIFGYQNCQKSNYDPASTSIAIPSESVSSQDMQIINLSDEQLQKIQFKSNEVQNVNHGSSTYSVVKTLLYDMDLVSGELHVIDQSAGTDYKYCLTESMKTQINELLNNSRICKGGIKITEGVVCAQSIQEGYANVVTNRDEFHLGSSTDGCGSNGVDLCENSDQLKLWFKNIKPQLSNLSCQ